MAEESQNDEKISVKFITKLPKFSLPDVLIDIPTSVTTKELNTMVNQLLYPDKAPEDHISFDFLVAGQLLRLSLKEMLVEKDIGEQVDIEYVEKLPPPDVGEWLQHDDWISSIQALDEHTILSACYDGTVRVWSGQGELQCLHQAHSSLLCAIKALSWLSDTSSATKRFVTCSDDGTAVMWRWVEANKDMDKPGMVVKEGVCPMPQLSESSMHVTKPKRVQCVATSPDLCHFATGSMDCVINVWSSGEVKNDDEDDDDADGVVKTQGNKRRKVEEGVHFRLPVQTIDPSSNAGNDSESHRAQITGLAWLDADKVMSCSLDQHVKIWDGKLGKMTSSITTSKPLLSLAYSPANNAFLTASCDRHIRMYDPRITSGGNLVKSSFSSHTGWVSGVAWSPLNPFLFMSASYDSLSKLWDTRSPKAPLYDLCGHGDRILCCDWSVGSLMLSGGVDAKMRVFHYKE